MTGFTGNFFCGTGLGCFATGAVGGGDIFAGTEEGFC